MRAAPVSIRRYLMLIVLTALLPMGLFAVGLLYFLWDNQQNQRNLELLARVRAMASVVESELESTVTRLRVLASDPQLDVDTLETFHERMRLLLQQNHDWANLSLLSPDRQLLSAAVPFGALLEADGQAPFEREVFMAGRPTTSDLFVTPTLGSPTVAIAVPVFQDDEAAYALVAALKLGYLGQRLDAIVPSDGVAGLFDRQLRFIARTRDPEPYIGKPPGKLLLDAMRERPEGVLRSVTREGESTFTAFVKLTDGWFVAVATPSAPVDRTFARYLAILGGAWLAILLLGLALTRILMARINRNVAATVNTASQLAAGKAVEFPRMAVAELAEIAGAIRSLFLRERQARAQEETANKAKDEFLAMLGHELRNPLAPITTSLELMRSRGDGVFAKEREIIQRQVQHMVRLVDDLLDVARIARGGVELKKSTVEISAIVSEAVETTDPLFKRKRLLLSVAVPPTGLRVEGDAARLVQVLSNLLANAAKFTRDEGRVAIAAAAVGESVEVTVSDDGAGMEASEMSRVFELFIQGQQSVDRPRGGLGLGLAIARSLARLHGGDVHAASDGPGKGSRFTLTLPLVHHHLPTDGGAGSIPEAVVEDKYVLIVDDNVDAAAGLSDLLRLWGLTTRIVHDGRQVIPAIRERTPDVVLLDIGLPGIDGYRLASLIRREPQWRNLRIIALTGYGQANDRERSLQAGIDLHLVKPVDLDQLAQALGKGPAQKEPPAAFT